MRRARHFRTKFDIVPILEGRQGSGKTSAVLRVLGGCWHSDAELERLDGKIAPGFLHDVWIPAPARLSCRIEFFWLYRRTDATAEGPTCFIAFFKRSMSWFDLEDMLRSKALRNAQDCGQTRRNVPGSDERRSLSRSVRPGRSPAKTGHRRVYERVSSDDVCYQVR